MNEVIGWREWVSLPELGIERIKAKIDTGARTSSLHAFDVRLDETSGTKIVKFSIHPKQRNLDLVIECQAAFFEEREVRDSGGHCELRYVIETQITLGETVRSAEVTLTNRDTMGFRMLLGRTAMKGHYIVDPGKSYLIHKRAKKRAKAKNNG